MTFARRGRLSVQFGHSRASRPRAPLDAQGWLLPGCAERAQVGPGRGPFYGSPLWELCMDEPGHKPAFAGKPLRGRKPGVCGKGINDTQLNLLFNHSESTTAENYICNCEWSAISNDYDSETR